MSQTRLDRRALLFVGTVGTAASALGLRAVLADEGEDHAGTPAAATPGATPGASPEAGTHLVEMTDELHFDPHHLTIRVGETVTWRTVGAVPHTSTCDPEKAQNPEEHVQLPEGAETWDSGTLEQGDEFERTFDVPGEYTYFCIPHEAQGMVAKLTVEE